jgi:hypothetical protein
MPARVQLVVEAKDETSGIFRALTSQMGAFGGLIEELTAKKVNWGNVAQQAAQMVIDGVKDAIKVTTEYAREVRDLSLASGQSAEESSRMLQVLDDYQLTAEDAKTATRALTKEGLAPTIETISKLSGEYLKLNTVEERNAFVQKNLGRAGQEWLNLLNQGPDAIMAMNDAVSEGLILTEENIRAAEEHRLALDAWNDAVMELKVSIGNELLPVLTQMMHGLASSNEIQAEANRLMMEGVAHNREEAMTMAAATVEAQRNSEAMTTNAAALTTAAQSASELEAAEKAATEAMRAMNTENQMFLGVMGQVGTAQKTYYDGLAAANLALADGKIKTAEHSAQVNQLALDYQAAKSQIVLSIVEMKFAADGWTNAELNAYLQVGQEMGQFTADQVSMAKGAVANADKIVAGFTGTTTAATKMSDSIAATGAAVIETTGPVNEMDDQVLHLGERAEDAAVDFGAMGAGAEELGASISTSAIPAVAGLKSAINQLQDKVVNIDVYIKTHGSLPKVGGGWGGGEHPGGGGQQMGGEVYAGQPTLVGEAGPEPFLPAVNGRILSHAESLHQLSLAGGMGQRNVFYGPVSLTIGEEGVGGIMGLR